MSDTQPAKEAVELARKWFRCPCGTPYGERRDYAGNSPPDDEPHAPEDFDAGVERMVVEIAAALDVAREKGWAKGYTAAINDCVTAPENQELAIERERARRIEENLKAAYRTADEAEDAYAVIRAERDAALALVRDEAATRATAERLLQVAQERVRVLEKAARRYRECQMGKHRSECDNGWDCATVFDAALAKAAAAPVVRQNRTTAEGDER